MANRPATLTAAAALEALEGVALVAAGVFVGIETVVARSYSLMNAIALAVCAVAVGVGVIAVARGLYQVRRWGRTPAALTQIFGFITAIYLLQAHQYTYGVPMMVITVVTLILLFSPPSTQALVDQP